MSVRASLVLVLLGLCAASTGLEAQWERERDRDRDRARGWIGISFEADRNRRGRVVGIVVTDVRRDSPAQEAGLREGDRILRVNDVDAPARLVNLTEHVRILEGDPVRILVQRDDRRREFRLRAARWPGELGAIEVADQRLEPDSMVESMYRAMESLKVRLVRRDQIDVRVTQGAARPPEGPPSAGSGAVVWQGGGQGDTWTVVSSGGGVSVQAPFEFFVFRGEEHDSLRREMESLNREVARLQERVRIRSREIERASRVSRSAPVEDAELGRLRRGLEEAALRAQSLRAAMADAARATAGFEYSVLDAPSGATRRVAAERPDEFRPLTPYLLGRNRVAGAEVIDLRPELAAYFQGVENGVLVVDVAPRTPASISGIQPGDVITRMDRVTVRTVEDLRFGVSRASDTLPITLIRRGTSIQLLLRR